MRAFKSTQKLTEKLEEEMGFDMMSQNGWARKIAHIRIHSPRVHVRLKIDTNHFSSDIWVDLPANEKDTRNSYSPDSMKWSARLRLRPDERTQVTCVVAVLGWLSGFRGQIDGSCHGFGPFTSTNG
jgi:hypothetical protein